MISNVRSETSKVRCTPCRYQAHHLTLPFADVKSLPLTVILAPFFTIIRSPLSTDPITSIALSALHSFFVCDLISAHSTSFEPALVELSSTVSQASDSSGDDPHS